MREAVIIDRDDGCLRDFACRRAVGVQLPQVSRGQSQQPAAAAADPRRALATAALCT